MVEDIGGAGRYIEYTKGDHFMYSMIVLAWAFGYGVGFEGYEKGKVYVGVYTPKTEYGWVISNRDVYLDTIFEKK